MLKAKNTALLVIDVQEKLFPHIQNRDGLEDRLSRLIRGCRVLELPILWTEQNPEGLGQTISTLSELLADEKPIEKTTFSCCRTKKFSKKLEDVSPKQVLVSGIETHVCVYQTAAQLSEMGYEVQVVADAVGSRSEENHQIGLHRISQCGGSLTCVETALLELLRDADDPKFKEILEIIK